MAVARFQLPDGKIARFEVPDGTTAEQAQAMVEKEFPNLVAPEKTAAGDQVGRQVGLTARGAVMGLTYPGRVAGDVLGLRSTEALSGLLNKFLPTPGTPEERISQDVVSAMSGAGGQAKIASMIGKTTGLAGPTLTRYLSELFAAGPGLQVTSGGLAAGAGGTTRELGGSPTAQTVATLVGGVVPAASQAGGAMAVRGLLRGGEEGRLRTAANMETFGAAGTTPTVGQATETRASRLAETMLGKTPGSAGVMGEKTAAQAQEIGAKVNDLTAQLSPRTGAAPAGRAIKTGISGENGFIENFRAKQKDLYGKLDSQIPKDSQVDMTNTANALSALNADIPGAPALSKFFKNSTIQAIEGAMKTDTGDWTTRLPYEALKKLRNLVGQELDNTNIASSVPRSKWSALYAGLSKDLEEAATAAGPDAVKAFERANTYTRAGHARIENVLQPVLNKIDPEDVFKAATAGTREGATTLWGIMRSVPDNAQRQVAATVLERMGVALPNKQGATGEVFSPETFLTNWNKIAPEAKTALFSRYGSDFTKNLDQIATVAQNLREGQKIFANPSGTEAALTSRLGLAGIIYGALFGHPGMAATLAGGMGAAHVASKQLLTNPEFVRWLAKSTQMPAGALPGQIIGLEKLAEKQPDDQAKAMKDFASSLKTR